jgi:hypothetical protein
MTVVRRIDMPVDYELNTFGDGPSSLGAVASADGRGSVSDEANEILIPQRVTFEWMTSEFGVAA